MGGWRLAKYDLFTGKELLLNTYEVNFKENPTNALVSRKAERRDLYKQSVHSTELAPLTPFPPSRCVSRPPT